MSSSRPKLNRGMPTIAPTTVMVAATPVAISASATTMPSRLPVSLSMKAVKAGVPWAKREGRLASENEGYVDIGR